MSTPELQPDELVDYDQLRRLLSPEVSLSLLDEFAKWLFTVAAIVGSLGTGFGLSGLSDLTQAGRRHYSWAVAAIALSLACATVARLPLPVQVNRYSIRSMKRAMNVVVWTRFILVLASGLSFAVALALAGWAQVS